MPGGCDIFDPFKADERHAALGLTPGDIYWRTREKVEVNGKCQYLVAACTPCCDVRGAILGSHEFGGTMLDAAPDAVTGDTVLVHVRRVAFATCMTLRIPITMRIAWPDYVHGPGGRICEWTGENALGSTIALDAPQTMQAHMECSPNAARYRICGAILSDGTLDPLWTPPPYAGPNEYVLGIIGQPITSPPRPNWPYPLHVDLGVADYAIDGFPLYERVGPPSYLRGIGSTYFTATIENQDDPAIDSWNILRIDRLNLAARYGGPVPSLSGTESGAEQIPPIAIDWSIFPYRHYYRPSWVAND